MGINWQAFDWQSFATLVTGLAAVSGAVVIGWRQNRITERQAKIAENQNAILGRQTALAELELRQSLFERRVVVYEIATNFLLTVFEKEDFADEDSRPFLVAIRDARWLFRSEVSDRLRSIWTDAIIFRAMKKKRRLLGKEALDQSVDDDEEHEKLTKLVEHHAALIGLFGPELKLSAID